MKMKMLPHVRAITHRHPIQVDLADQPAFYERIQAIVNRGHGNIGHPLLGPHKDLLRRRMIALAHQHAVNVLPLGSLAEPARRQAFGEPLIELEVSTLHCTTIGNLLK